MIAIYVLFALDMLNLSLFMPIFNKYVLSLGGSYYFMGLVGSSGALVSLIWRPIAGGLSDKNGRKGIILWCLGLCLLGNIITQWCTSLYLLFFARVLCAFGSPMQTLLRTMVADILPGNDTESAVFNKIGIVLSISFMTGALTSGFLSEYTYGFHLIFLLISINLVVSFAVIYLLPSTGSKPKSKKEASNSNIFSLNLKQLKLSYYWEIFTIKGLLDLSYGIMQMNMGLILLSHFNIDGRYMGYIFCLFGIVSVLTNVIIVKLNNTYYKEDKGFLRMLHGCCLLIISYLGLGISSIFSLFVCFIITNTVSRTALDSALFDALNNKVNGNEKGTVMSLFDGIFSLSELIAPILSSVLVTVYGERNTIVMCSIPAALAASISYLKKPSIKINTD